MPAFPATQRRTDTPDGEPAGPAVLRLCSVFEPPAGTVDRPGASRFDPIGGMQNHTAELTRGLDRLGVRQTVLTSRLAAPRGTTALSDHTVVCRTGVRTAHARQLWALWALPRALRPGHRVDVVHAHQGEDLAVLVLGVLAARVHRCALVVTLHNSVAHTLLPATLRACLLRTVAGPVEVRTVRRADALLVLTDRARRAALADGATPSRVHVVPSGVDPGLFDDPGPDPFPAAGRPRVLYVGRLAVQKGVADLVRAFAGVPPPARLLVVGDGPERGRLEALTADVGLRDRVTFTGFVEHSAVPSVLCSGDVLVLPSRYEEMGSVLVEALRAGLPVVAYRVGGIPEVVEDGHTGVLVEPGDVAGLTAAVRRLLQDEPLRRRMAEHSRTRAEAYSWPRLTDRVLSAYRDAVSRRGGGAVGSRAGRAGGPPRPGAPVGPGPG